MDSDDHRLMRLPEVVRLCGISRSQLYRMVRSGEFPAPVRISRRAVAWREKEILAWLEDRPVASIPVDDALAISPTSAQRC